MKNQKRFARGRALALSWIGAALVAQVATGAGPASVRDGVYSLAQAEAGKAVYTSKCSSCHGVSLTGGMNEAPALKGDRFVSAWDGKPLRAVYSRIISTMPLSDPGSLSEEEALDLVAYLLQANGFPDAQQTALQSPEALGAIRFERGN